MNASTSRSFRRWNWPLLWGCLFVALVLVITFAGPTLAPRDPLDENLVMQVEGKWFNAPYPPFTIPDMPLGSDRWGRDVLSQMLWALRPTMMLVGVVALIRLSVGTVLGLAAGWATGQVKRTLDALISMALAVPVLFVALAVVSFAGLFEGPQAFLIGLALTGWAETARFVRDQTQIFKGQLFVEAARALGAGSYTLLFNHILRQIKPLLWMVLAYEISATMLITAGLGFLGYYVGGDVWVWVSDTAATRLSGSPELGQMLASVTEDIYTGPWMMFAAGTMVFITVLGFNLLGEGLRLQANLEYRSVWLYDLKFRLKLWWEEHLLYPAQTHPVRAALVGAIVLPIVFVTAYFTYQTFQPEPAPLLKVPGDHIWASIGHDPYATYTVDFQGPQQGNLLWTYQGQSGFSGGPVIASNEILYLTSFDGTLHALDLEGNLLWKVSLGFEPFGTPALGEEGQIFIAGADGSLHAFTAEGRELWTLPGTEHFPATGSPIVGLDGAIYYTIVGDVRAVSSEGQALWQARPATRRLLASPSISPHGEFVFFREKAMQASDGTILPYDNFPRTERFLVSPGGQIYSRFEGIVTEWTVFNEEVRVVRRFNWRPSFFLGFPGLEGALSNGTIWFHYNSIVEDGSFVWVDSQGEPLGFIRFPQRLSLLMGIDHQSTFYACGTDIFNSHALCNAFQPEQTDALWGITLEGGKTVKGGALSPERLYVVLEEGYLYALGE